MLQCLARAVHCLKVSPRLRTQSSRGNYVLNELGIARVYPNVRGSTGYGRAFLDLDNATRRLDAVKDVGALLDWIKIQPDLDADRVLIEAYQITPWCLFREFYTPRRSRNS